MEKIRKAIQSGTFEMALPKCELRQRGADTPIVFSGPGLVSQNADRHLVLRVFAPPPEDFVGTINRSLNQDFVAGQLTPETDNYDMIATDMYGAQWVAERVRVNPHYSFFGTYIQVDPSRIESTRERRSISAHARLDTFVQGKIDLPWNLFASPDNRGVSGLFEGSFDHITWTARRADDGVYLSVSAINQSIEPVFKAFLRALSILTGRALHAEVFWITERQSHTERISNGYREIDDAQLLSPIRIDLEHVGQANAFIAAYLRCSLFNDDR